MDAKIKENIFPKLLLAVILIYFIILKWVFLPSLIPFLKTFKSFFKRIISALSLAISHASLTDIPISAFFNAKASLIPSPINPTLWLLFFKHSTIYSF